MAKSKKQAVLTVAPIADNGRKSETQKSKTSHPIKCQLHSRKLRLKFW